MKYTKKVLLAHTSDQINRILIKVTRNAFVLSLINMMMCGLNWLLHEYTIRYVFFAASCALMPYLIVLIVRIVRIDKVHLAKLKEEEKWKRQAFEAIEAEYQLKNTKGGNQ